MQPVPGRQVGDPSSSHDPDRAAITPPSLPEGAQASAQVADGMSESQVASPSVPLAEPRATREPALPSGRFSGGLRAVLVRSGVATRLVALDGARAIAVLFVIVYHSWLNRCGTYRHACAPEDTGEPLSVSAVGLLIGHGDLGVDIFFVLSGYLIFLVLYRKLGPSLRSAAPAIGRFIARRFLRIYPALAVMVPLCTLFFWFVPGLDGGARALIDGCAVNGLTTYALINNIPQVAGALLDLPGSSLACAPWTWSVSVEWQLYLLTPLIVWAYVRVRDRRARAGRPVHWWTGGEAAIGLLTVAVLFQVVATLQLGLASPGLEPEVFDTYMVWLYGNPLARCTPYLLGMAAAAYTVHRDDAHALPPSTRLEDLAARPLTLRLALGVFVFLCVFGVLPFYPWFGFNLVISGMGRTLFGAAVVIVLVAATRPGPPTGATVRMLRHALWHPIATLSYSAYLWQFAGIEAARAIFGDAGIIPYESFAAWLGFAALGTLLTFAFALPSYLLVERPGMSLRPAA